MDGEGVFPTKIEKGRGPFQKTEFQKSETRCPLFLGPKCGKGVVVDERRGSGREFLREGRTGVN